MDTDQRRCGIRLDGTLAVTALRRPPRREDRGDLIVLHLYGLYYEMGRQQAELLGPVARRNNPSEREAAHADIHQQTDGEHAGEQ